LRETKSVRDRQAMAGVSHAIFRAGAAWRQRADLVADVPFVCCRILSLGCAFNDFPLRPIVACLPLSVHLIT
jgi:hypothetical protein